MLNRKTKNFFLHHVSVPETRRDDIAQFLLQITDAIVSVPVPGTKKLSIVDCQLTIDNYVKTSFKKENPPSTSGPPVLPLRRPYSA